MNIIKWGWRSSDAAAADDDDEVILRRVGGVVQGAGEVHDVPEGEEEPDLCAGLRGPHPSTLQVREAAIFFFLMFFFHAFSPLELNGPAVDFFISSSKKVFFS